MSELKMKDKYKCDVILLGNVKGKSFLEELGQPYISLFFAAPTRFPAIHWFDVRLLMNSTNNDKTATLGF